MWPATPSKLIKFSIYRSFRWGCRSTICHVTCLIATLATFSCRIQESNLHYSRGYSERCSDLINEVPWRIHFLIRETYVLTWCRTVWKKGTNEGHRHIFLDDIHWVSRYQRFRHLSSLLVWMTVDRTFLNGWRPVIPMIGRSCGHPNDVVTYLPRLTLGSNVWSLLSRHQASP